MSSVQVIQNDEVMGEFSSWRQADNLVQQLKAENPNASVRARFVGKPDVEPWGIEVTCTETPVRFG
jgi:hypothetical protein